MNKDDFLDEHEKEEHGMFVHLRRSDVPDEKHMDELRELLVRFRSLNRSGQFGFLKFFLELMNSPDSYEWRSSDGQSVKPPRDLGAAQTNGIRVHPEFLVSPYEVRKLLGEYRLKAVSADSEESDDAVYYDEQEFTLLSTYSRFSRQTMERVTGCIDILLDDRVFCKTITIPVYDLELIIRDIFNRMQAAGRPFIPNMSAIITALGDQAENPVDVYKKLCSKMEMENGL